MTRSILIIVVVIGVVVWGYIGVLRAEPIKYQLKAGDEPKTLYELLRDR